MIAVSGDAGGRCAIAVKTQKTVCTVCTVQEKLMTSMVEAGVYMADRKSRVKIYKVGDGTAKNHRNGRESPSITKVT